MPASFSFVFSSDGLECVKPKGTRGNVGACLSLRIHHLGALLSERGEGLSFFSNGQSTNSVAALVNVLISFFLGDRKRMGGSEGKEDAAHEEDPAECGSGEQSVHAPDSSADIRIEIGDTEGDPGMVEDICLCLPHEGPKPGDMGVHAGRTPGVLLRVPGVVLTLSDPREGSGFGKSVGVFELDPCQISLRNFEEEASGHCPLTSRIFRSRLWLLDEVSSMEEIMFSLRFDLCSKGMPDSERERQRFIRLKVRTPAPKGTRVGLLGIVCNFFKSWAPKPGLMDSFRVVNKSLVPEESGFELSGDLLVEHSLFLALGLGLAKLFRSLDLGILPRYVTYNLCVSGGLRFFCKSGNGEAVFLASIRSVEGQEIKHELVYLPVSRERPMAKLDCLSYRRATFGYKVFIGGYGCGKEVCPGSLRLVSPALLSWIFSFSGEKTPLISLKNGYLRDADERRVLLALDLLFNLELVLSEDYYLVLCYRKKIVCLIHLSHEQPRKDVYLIPCVLGTDGLVGWRDCRGYDAPGRAPGGAPREAGSLRIELYEGRTCVFSPEISDFRLSAYFCSMLKVCGLAGYYALKGADYVWEGWKSLGCIEDCIVSSSGKSISRHLRDRHEFYEDIIRDLKREMEKEEVEELVCK
jgi:hypothetical protein